MATVAFTSHLERYVACPPAAVPGGTVAEVLSVVFRDNPILRGYVVDDQGSLRKHIAIFVDGRPVQDRATLSDPVGETSEVYVLQALSGGS